MCKQLKVLIGMLLFLSIIFISACETIKSKPTTEKVSSSKGQYYKKTSKQIFKASKAKYIQQNAIEIIDYKVKIDTKKGSYHVITPKIKGLKNDKIQTKVNQSIKENFISSAKAFVNNSGALPEIISYSWHFNSNNVLSLSIFSPNSSYEVGFTYNLVNGKRIHLKDLFVKGTDYISLINEKIIYNILTGYYSEEEILKSPFTSIEADHNFTINERTLNIIFFKGEAGFISDFVVSIPLAEVGEYLEIFNKYQNEKNDIYSAENTFPKYNNIFLSEKYKVVKVNNWRLEFSYSNISGLVNQVVEEKINTEIQDIVDKFQNSEFIKKTTTNTSEKEKAIRISFYNSFNNYDYISLSLNAQYVIDDEYLNIIEYKESYCVDLKTGDFAESSELLKNFINSKEEYKERFEKVVKKMLLGPYSDLDYTTTCKIKDEVDSEFILKNAYIGFGYYDLKEGPILIIEFDKGVLCDKPLYASISLFSEFEVPFDAFFK